MKNKLLGLLLIMLLVCGSANISLAASVIPQKDVNVTVNVMPEEDEDCDEAELIKRFSLKDKFKKTPENQIKDFFKKYNRYSSKNRVDKLKEMYTDDYANNDGFNKKTVFEMMDMASSSYKDVVYNTEIENISVDGNYAVVKVKEMATGQTVSVFDRVNDTGSITSELHFIDYMKKEGNNWKISATEVVYEKVALLYGEAKSLALDISAPDCVPANSEYDVTLKTTIPENTFMVASISNDKIVFPQERTRDVYRSIRNGELARILKANKTNNNEYATASIALTKAKVEPSSVILDMTGIAFVMKRVNVLSINENIKLNKENSNAETVSQ